MENNTETLSSVGQPTASAEELVKRLRKESRQKFLDKIRGRLGSVVHQLAFSPAEAAIACGKSPTWAYRKIYSGDFRVLNAEDGRLSIPRSEIEHYLGGAEKYNPEPKGKIGGEGNGCLLETMNPGANRGVIIRSLRLLDTDCSRFCQT